MNRSQQRENVRQVVPYPIQKVTEMYKKVTELEISSWNVLSLLRSEVAYIGTEPILP
jgi:hypothetical protein